MKFYYPSTHSIYWTPYPWYFDTPTHGILTPLTMVYRPPYPWYIDSLPMVYQPPYPWYINPPNHIILTPYPWYIDAPTHGISTHLPMVYWPPYPWYINPQPMLFWPPCSWNIDPLPMVYQILSYGIMNSSLLVEMKGGFNLPWGGSKYNDKKIDPRVKIPYGKLNLG